MRRFAAVIFLGALSVGVSDAAAQPQTNPMSPSRASQKANRKQQKAQKKYAKAQRKAERKMLKTERKNTRYPSHQPF
jgi:hypothetical protein